MSRSSAPVRLGWASAAAALLASLVGGQGAPAAASEAGDLPTGPFLMPEDVTPIPEEAVVEAIDVEVTSDGFVIAAAGSHSMVDAVVAAAEEKPEIATQATEILDSMAERGELDSDEAADGVQAIASGAPSGMATTSAASSVPPQVGHSVGNNRAWFARRWINGIHCKGKTCTEVARITAEFTVNPGAKTSRVQYGVTGLGWSHFYNERVGALVNYGGNDHGSRYRDVYGTTKNHLDITSPTRRNGSNIRHYVTLQGTLSCAGLGCSRDLWVEQRGRTGWAACRTSDNVCIY